MEPQYSSGDFVLVSQPIFRTLSIGDDIVCRHQRLGIIIKRILSIEEDMYWLEGLNSKSTSTETIGKIPAKEILGRVLFHFSP